MKIYGVCSYLTNAPTEKATNTPIFLAKGVIDPRRPLMLNNIIIFLKHASKIE